MLLRDWEAGLEGQKRDQEGKRKKGKIYCIIAFWSKGDNTKEKMLSFELFTTFSTLLHLPPLRFNRVGGCWDRTVATLALAVRRSNHSTRSHPKNLFRSTVRIMKAFLNYLSCNIKSRIYNTKHNKMSWFAIYFQKIIT